MQAKFCSVFFSTLSRSSFRSFSGMRERGGLRNVAALVTQRSEFTRVTRVERVASGRVLKSGVVVVVV